MRSIPRLPTLCALLLLTLACGEKPADTESSDASSASSSGASASASESDTTVSGTTTGTTGPTSGGTLGETTGGLCDDLLDVTPTPAVTITLRNTGSAPVFFVHATGCEFVEPLAIAGPDGDTPIEWRQDLCDFTCSQLFAEQCACPGSCAQDSVLMLASGGAYTISWSGAIYVPTTVPPACAGEICGDMCMQVVQAPAGAYELHAIGGSEVSGCADPDMCSCTPNAEGWCDVSATGVGGTPREALATLQYPAETAGELVFP